MRLTSLSLVLLLPSALATATTDSISRPLSLSERQPLLSRTLQVRQSAADKQCTAEWGVGNVACGLGSCYNPKSGESCCGNTGNYCPAGQSCSTTGYTCIVTPRKLHVGMIIGGIVAALVILALIGAFFFIMRARRNRLNTVAVATAGSASSAPPAPPQDNYQQTQVVPPMQQYPPQQTAPLQTNAAYTAYQPAVPYPQQSYDTYNPILPPQQQYQPQPPAQQDQTTGYAQDSKPYAYDNSTRAASPAPPQQQQPPIPKYEAGATEGTATYELR